MATSWPKPGPQPCQIMGPQWVGLPPHSGVASPPLRFPSHLPRTSAHCPPSHPLCCPYCLLVPSSSRLPESSFPGQDWLVLFFQLISHLPCRLPQLLGTIRSSISLSRVLLRWAPRGSQRRCVVLWLKSDCSAHLPKGTF